MSCSRRRSARVSSSVSQTVTATNASPTIADAATLRSQGASTSDSLSPTHTISGRLRTRRAV